MYIEYELIETQIFSVTCLAKLWPSFYEFIFYLFINKKVPIKIWNSD